MESEPAASSPAVTLADDGPLLRATAELPPGSAGRALAAFTDPAQLAQWWTGELEADLTAGGRYQVRFPRLPATMTGQVVSFDPAASLEFSWAWADEPDEPARTVSVRVSDGPPPVLTLVHGPYAATPAGRQARADQRAGWEHFLPRLVALLADQQG